MILAIELNSELAGTIAVVAAIVVAFWAVVTDRRRMMIIETQNQLYEIKKEELQVEREARERERAECTMEISRLEARLSTLESNWMRSLSKGVAEGVLQHLHQMTREERHGH
jgi:ABC-type phosphate transport system auxiliary subunit